MQLVTAISSIVNGGNLLTPRVVKSVIDVRTGEEKEIPVDIRAKDRKSTRLNSSHIATSRMPSSA